MHSFDLCASFNKLHNGGGRHLGWTLISSSSEYHPVYWQTWSCLQTDVADISLSQTNAVWHISSPQPLPLSLYPSNTISYEPESLTSLIMYFLDLFAIKSIWATRLCVLPLSVLFGQIIHKSLLRFLYNKSNQARDLRSWKKAKDTFEIKHITWCESRGMQKRYCALKWVFSHIWKFWTLQCKLEYIQLSFSYVPKEHRNIVEELLTHSCHAVSFELSNLKERKYL